MYQCISVSVYQVKGCASAERAAAGLSTPRECYLSSHVCSEREREHACHIAGLQACRESRHVGSSGNIIAGEHACREQRASMPGSRGAGEQRASMPAALADSSPHDTSVIQNAGEFRECGC